MPTPSARPMTNSSTVTLVRRWIFRRREARASTCSAAGVGPMATRFWPMATAAPIGANTWDPGAAPAAVAPAAAATTGAVEPGTCGAGGMDGGAADAEYGYGW